MLWKLQEIDYFIEYKTHINEEVAHLFFAHSKSIELFKCYSEVLIMDCIYKTNWFNIPLLNIINIMALNILFFIGFAYIAREANEDYLWVIKELKTLMCGEDINNSAIVVTNCKLVLINTLKKGFP